MSGAPSERPGRESLVPAAEIPPQVGKVIAAVVVAVAFVGFVTGTRGGGEPTASAAALLGEHPDEEGGAPPAPRHEDLASDDVRRTDARQIASFERLLEDRRGLEDEVVLSDEARARALAERAARRAYDGAPPRIPHAVRQMSRPDCLACHERGLRVAERVAPAMSHEPYASCVQCHVVDGAPMPGGAAGLESDPPWASDFVGLEAPERGPRVWDGAPPVIPHATRMRERCGSCHGVLAEGLASSHPWRQSCTQCHAPSAAFDQVPSGGVAAPVGGEP